MNNVEIIIEMNEGGNLISLWALPSDVYVGPIMESVEEFVTGIIGEGVAVFWIILH